ncbi:hypothetical protein [Candidatus Symbiopectobacterium sp. NZEC135]|uniref:OspG family effector kinase n=1 Tax=Candidatus Symbiopectobacterium sp. NZEC135 TaxID=2820471 RepID=UPI00222659BC|nr:hypothetical protein [Candidatus Symbiopectobacterium sp. NZEC135]MCW2480797.1 hypothetical protein [Candidatus Symbiopectobacterium sp. NZEC135]
MRIYSSIINPCTDSLDVALAKKSKNAGISRKTLNKLVKIASTSIGLSKKEARDIFFNSGETIKTPEAKQLSNKICKALPYVSNQHVKQLYTTWMKNCGVTIMPKMPDVCSYSDFMHEHSNMLGNMVTESKEAVVVIDKLHANRLIKIFFDGESPGMIKDQTEAFNRYYGDGSASELSGRAIVLTNISGCPLSQVNQFHEDADVDFVKTVARMIDNDVHSIDFSKDDFLYNTEYKSFLPIDMKTLKIDAINHEALQSALRYIRERVLNGARP